METMTQTIENAEALLGAHSVKMTRKNETWLDVELTPDQLPGAVQALVDGRWGYLAAINGLDHPAPQPAEGEPAAENIVELMYHFFEGDKITNLRVFMPYSALAVPTICNILPAATLYEREMQEMFGVVMVGTPDPSRLLLPDDWPADVFPLRKSYSSPAAGSAQA